MWFDEVPPQRFSSVCVAIPELNRYYEHNLGVLVGQVLEELSRLDGRAELGLAFVAIGLQWWWSRSRISSHESEGIDNLTADSLARMVCLSHFLVRLFLVSYDADNLNSWSFNISCFGRCKIASHCIRSFFLLPNAIYKGRMPALQIILTYNRVLFACVANNCDLQ